MSDLIELLSSLSSVLTCGDEPRWGLRCGELANRLAAAPRSHWPDLAREGLRWFAGSGSLNDLVLYPAGRVDAGLNDEFAALAASLHAALTGALNAGPPVDAMAAYHALHAELDHLRTEIDWAVRGRRSPPYRSSLRLAQGIPQEYQQLCPEYLLARCPLCGALLQERIDTYSLAGMGWWRMPPDGTGWMGRYFGGDGRALCPPGQVAPYSYRAGCAHVQGVMYGVNLQGVLPDDVPQVHELPLGAAVPHLHRPFMALAGSRAVLRTLAIGRLDRPGRPYYTVWLASYFHPEAGALAATLAPQDSEHRLFRWPYADAAYDLGPWLASGQVFWLDEVGELHDHGPVLAGWQGNWVRERGQFFRLPDAGGSLARLERSVQQWPEVLRESAAGLTAFPLQSLAGAR
ncbi:hypothetical protein [Chitinilyticum piscinae]|uniref:Uncharacterized protein n=1 Tax=Chitinilyticum piscinae TaxID=2866724 RepID=A0A8J7FGU9_9NEIS|nr:hypothetical protein [Chitinilyticum piscinae]MBE9607905.1 hypothetical protein [Chitinilyticum piscinae]